jgi:hypothetical protein
MDERVDARRFLGHWLVCLDSGILLYATMIIERIDDPQPVLQGYTLDGSKTQSQRFAVVERDCALILTSLFRKDS